MNRLRFEGIDIDSQAGGTLNNNLSESYREQNQEERKQRLKLIKKRIEEYINYTLRSDKDFKAATEILKNIYANHSARLNPEEIQILNDLIYLDTHMPTVVRHIEELHVSNELGLGDDDPDRQKFKVGKVGEEKKLKSLNELDEEGVEQVLEQIHDFFRLKRRTTTDLNAQLQPPNAAPFLACLQWATLHQEKIAALMQRILIEFKDDKDDKIGIKNNAELLRNYAISFIQRATKIPLLFSDMNKACYAVKGNENSLVLRKLCTHPAALMIKMNSFCGATNFYKVMCGYLPEGVLSEHFNLLKLMTRVETRDLSNTLPLPQGGEAEEIAADSLFGTDLDAVFNPKMIEDNHLAQRALDYIDECANAILEDLEKELDEKLLLQIAKNFIAVQTAIPGGFIKLLRLGSDNLDGVSEKQKDFLNKLGEKFPVIKTRGLSEMEEIRMIVMSALRAEWEKIKSEKQEALKEREQKEGQDNQEEKEKGKEKEKEKEKENHPEKRQESDNPYPTKWVLGEEEVVEVVEEYVPVAPESDQGGSPQAVPRTSTNTLDKDVSHQGNNEEQREATNSGSPSAGVDEIEENASFKQEIALIEKQIRTLQNEIAWRQFFNNVFCSLFFSTPLKEDKKSFFFSTSLKENKKAKLEETKQAIEKTSSTEKMLEVVRAAKQDDKIKATSCRLFKCRTSRSEKALNNILTMHAPKG